MINTLPPALINLLEDFGQISLLVQMLREINDFSRYEKDSRIYDTALYFKASLEEFEDWADSLRDDLTKEILKEIQKLGHSNEDTHS